MEPQAWTHNTTQRRLTSENGTEYLIQVSWPLEWKDRKPEGDVAVIYLMDGNSVFFSTTEEVRRRRWTLTILNAIVVAISYPLKEFVYSMDRDYDLTPPCEKYTPPPGFDGNPRPRPHGGADKLLDFIQQTVRPFVFDDIFGGLIPKKECLWGHSYGGLFVLHTLFTRTAAFDTYVAASPSIWWNEKFILSEKEKFIKKCTELQNSAARKPALYMGYGSNEQYPKRLPDESDEKFNRRKEMAAMFAMTDNATQLASDQDLKNQLRALHLDEHIDEDHGSVIGFALSKGITAMLSKL